MKNPNLPPSWRNMGFGAKAGWLVGRGLAKNYSEACSKLARLPRRKKIKAIAK